MLRSMTNISQLKNRLMCNVKDAKNGEKLLRKRLKSIKRRVSCAKTLAFHANLQEITRIRRIRRSKKSKRVFGSAKTTKEIL